MVDTDDEISTERLQLRRFTDDDAQFAYDLHQNPDLVRFIPSAALGSLDDARGWLDRIAGNEGPGRGWWCVTVGGTPVAAILLKEIRASQGHETDDVEIGWRQHASYVGHGYVTEAARAVLDVAWATGLARVVAVVDPDNTASQRVCERLGMAHAGRTQEYYDQELELFEIARP